MPIRSRFEHPTPQHNDIVAVAEALREAWYSNRPIVPIVGAGLSADSGFPVIRSVVRYLAKLYAGTDRGAPFARVRFRGVEWLREMISGRYREKPWYYVTDFGWPDRFELQQDLLRDCNDGAVSAAVSEVLTRLTPLINPASNYPFDRLQSDIIQLVQQVPGANHLVAEIHTRFARDRGGWSVPYDVSGDWRRLIQHLTGFQPDYADALFAALGENKQPNLGHRYLAFLIRLLSVRTVFTFNFDELIERSLEAEGFRPKVFAMEEGRNLPHKSLAGDTAVSVVKLHGSTHSLLLDERLDRPLTREYLHRFDQLVGTDPLLLVVGCSGGDRRLISLIEHVLTPTRDNLRVAWLHFESYRPPFLMQQDDPNTFRRGACAAETPQPAASLVHLYSHLTGRYPASARPYVAGAGQALGYPPASGYRVNNLEQIVVGPKKMFWLRSIELADVDRRESAGSFPRTTASEVQFAVADFGLRRGYTPIIINLEWVHTLGGLVGAVVDRCRQYDSTLAPSVLPSEDPAVWETPGAVDGLVNKAVALVANALQRSRYLILLEGIETYLWNAISHHGETNVGAERLRPRFGLLCEFLARLDEAQGVDDEKRPRLNDIGESRIVLTLDARSFRNESSADQFVDLSGLLTPRLKGLGQLTMTGTNDPGGTRQFDEVFRQTGVYPFQTFRSESSARNALVLFLLTACRRARPLALVRHLLYPILGSGQKIDAWLAARVRAADRCGFLTLAGGATWLSWPVRNQVYSLNTRHTSTGRMSEILEKNQTDQVAECVTQLVVSYAVHFRLTRTYYVYTFRQSNDALAFLEYTYHRISTLRYLVKLIAVLQWARGNPERADRVLAGLKAAGAFLQEAVGTEPGEAVGSTRYQDLLRRLQMRSKTLLHQMINGRGGADSVGALEDELMRRHVKEARALLRAWRRHEPLLRMQLPAEQLLHWCERLAEDDLRYRCDKVVVGYDRVTSNGSTVPRTWPWPADKVLTGTRTIEEFAQFICDLQVKLWAERGDNDRVMRVRYTQICSGSPPERSNAPGELDLNAVVATLIDKRGTWYDTPARHHVLDVVNALIKRSQCDRLPQDWELAGRLLDAVRPQEPGDPPAGNTPENCSRHEAALRYYHLKAEHELRAISLFAEGFREAPTRRPQTSGERANETALQAVDTGMEETRHQLPFPDDLPRSVVIDRMVDGTLYSQYQTVFDMLRGRVRWGRTLQEFPTHTIWSAECDQFYRDEFQAAFRYFELAKGGLDRTNPLLLGLVEIYSAEACLGIARLQLYRAQEAANAGVASRVGDLLAEARAKHASARGCLLRCRECLLDARRNVVWWRLFFTMVAQYHADRLTLAFVQLFSDPVLTTDGTVGLKPEWLSRLRKGYNAVRHAAEFRTSSAPPDPWLVRVWAELTLAGAGLILKMAAVITAQSNKPKLSLDVELDLAVDLITQLHDAERLLPDTAARWSAHAQPRQVRGQIEQLLSEQERLVRDAVPELERPFQLRAQLLKLAQGLSHTPSV